MSETTKVGQWAAFAAKLEALTDKLIDAIPLEEEIVRLTATGLLCRTFHHFRALRMLIQSGFVVEGRILTRCCFENMFWIAALAVKGPAFIKEVANDHDVQNAKFGNAVLEWSKKNAGDATTEEPLSAYLDNLKDNEEGKSAIALYNAAVTGKVKDAYIIYRDLSGDSAHPTARSIDRHISERCGVSRTSKAQLLDNDEAEGTLHFACTALVSVCIAAQDILKTPLREELASLVDEYLALHKPQK